MSPPRSKCRKWYRQARKESHFVNASPRDYLVGERVYMEYLGKIYSGEVSEMDGQRRVVHADDEDLGTKLVSCISLSYDYERLMQDCQITEYPANIKKEKEKEAAELKLRALAVKMVAKKKKKKEKKKMKRDAEKARQARLNYLENFRVVRDHLYPELAGDRDTEPE